MKRYVKAKVTFEGIHNWENCPIEEVSFLRHPHRHKFTIIAKKEVTHNDRDTEFIVLGRKILNYIDTTYKKAESSFDTYLLGSQSCEMIAEDILKQFNLVECEVWEDMENCGIVSLM